MSHIWTTREGVQIPVERMETSHIRNALTMLRRKGFVSPSTVEFYFGTAGPRGEMAQMCFERELEEVLDAPVSPAIDWFEEELARRGEPEEVKP